MESSSRSIVQKTVPYNSIYIRIFIYIYIYIYLSPCLIRMRVSMGQYTSMWVCLKIGCTPQWPFYKGIMILWTNLTNGSRGSQFWNTFISTMHGLNHLRSPLLLVKFPQWYTQLQSSLRSQTSFFGWAVSFHRWYTLVQLQSGKPTRQCWKSQRTPPRLFRYYEC